MLYTVTAYRWGYLNGHQYAVATLGDSTRAREIAQEACDDRAGKYGVAVYEWTSEGEFSPIAYFPSLHGEKAPFHNERLDLFSSIGHDIHAIVTTGVEWLPCEEEPSRLLPALASDPASWTLASVRRHEINCRFTESLQAELASAPQEKTARSAWLEARYAAAEQATDELLSQGLRMSRERYLAGSAHRQERNLRSTLEACDRATEPEKPPRVL
jgi:hypothetical protein